MIEATHTKGSFSQPDWDAGFIKGKQIGEYNKNRLDRIDRYACAALAGMFAGILSSVDVGLNPPIEIWAATSALDAIKAVDDAISSLEDENESTAFDIANAKPLDPTTPNKGDNS